MPIHRKEELDPEDESAKKMPDLLVNAMQLRTG